MDQPWLSGPLSGSIRVAAEGRPFLCLKAEPRCLAANALRILESLCGAMERLISEMRGSAEAGRGIAAIASERIALIKRLVAGPLSRLAGAERPPAGLAPKGKRPAKSPKTGSRKKRRA